MQSPAVVGLASCRAAGTRLQLGASYGLNLVADGYHRLVQRSVVYFSPRCVDEFVIGIAGVKQESFNPIL
jgi:hypothetical protein